MNIGVVSERINLPAKTIRYYEEIGLVCPDRRENGYRHYSDNDIHKLAFIQRARALGFTIDECRQLLGLYDDRDRASADVKALAEQHLDHIDAKLRELEEMKRVLEDLVRSCRGDRRPECPILERLSDGVVGA